MLIRRDSSGRRRLHVIGHVATCVIASIAHLDVNDVGPRPCARSQEARGRCAGKPTHLMTARFNCHFQCRHWRSTVASCTMSRLNKEEPWPPFPIYTGHICDCCRYNRSPRPHTSKATQHGGICARVRSADDVGGRAGGGDRDRVDDDGHCRPGSPQPTPGRSAVLR